MAVSSDAIPRETVISLPAFNSLIRPRSETRLCERARAAAAALRLIARRVRRTVRTPRGHLSNGSG